MKRWIHTQSQKIKVPTEVLHTYSEEQIDFVIDCYEDILSDIADQYTFGHAIDEESARANVSEIKSDYLMCALEDELLTEEEFNIILDALESSNQTR